ncbi:MAG TPA: hypothetical protein PKH32_10260, partial [Verrucomicrobiota bacterium]|nr:hypothetical protein [Verrucomicrobiota bacterium]
MRIRHPRRVPAAAGSVKIRENGGNRPKPGLRAAWILLLAFAAPVVGIRTTSAAPMLTRWAAEVSPTNVWPEYPRPQMVRERWLNLNGHWDYAVTSNSRQAPAQFEGRILVPFPIESHLSGVGRRITEHDVIWYRRHFTVPSDWRGQSIRLHFGAVDWETTVFVNGREIGSHRGGYDAFTFDITSAVKWGGPNELVV